MLSRKKVLGASTTNHCGANTSAEIIAHNHGLVMEILARCPVKSLLRFKSVSKRWYSLISDPGFSSCYRLLDSVFGLFLSTTCNEFVPLGDKSFDHSPLNPFTLGDNPCSKLAILQSCNGLLCCCGQNAYSNKHDYYIFNPTTKQVLKLPQLPIEKTITIHGVGLAFDPTKSPYYKVVFVREPDGYIDFPNDDEELGDDNYSTYQIEIYSSQTGSWQPFGQPFIAEGSTRFKGGVFCNGAIHWINDWGTSLYFNVDEGKLGDMPTLPPVPEGWEETRGLRYFGESRNHLHVIEIYPPCTTRFDVYEMESDYSKWFVKYHVDLGAMPTSFPEMVRDHLDPSDLLHYCRFSILCLVREANDEESYLVLHIPGKAIHYNLKDGKFKRICDLAPRDYNIDHDATPTQAYLRYGWFDAFQFIPSLSCV